MDTRFSSSRGTKTFSKNWTLVHCKVVLDLTLYYYTTIKKLRKTLKLRATHLSCNYDHLQNGHLLERARRLTFLLTFLVFGMHLKVNSLKTSHRMPLLVLEMSFLLIDDETGAHHAHLVKYLKSTLNFTRIFSV